MGSEMCIRDSARLASKLFPETPVPEKVPPDGVPPLKGSDVSVIHASSAVKAKAAVGLENTSIS